MECQRRKALAAKAREEANSEPLKDQITGDLVNNQALEMPPPSQPTIQVIAPLSLEEAKESIVELVSQKCLRGSLRDKSETFVPSCNIRSSDSIISKVPEAARQPGGHLCRGMILPKDK